MHLGHLGLWLGAAALGLGCGGGGGGSASTSPVPPPAPGLTVVEAEPADPMPTAGQGVEFRLQVNEDQVTIQWLRDGVPVPGATGAVFSVGSVRLKRPAGRQVAPADAVTALEAEAGVYQAQVSDGVTTVLTTPYSLEPVDTEWVVTTGADSGPGSLRDTLAAANQSPGVNGLTFAIPGPAPHTIALTTGPLAPITGHVTLLASPADPVVVDGGGAFRPFFVDGGALVLDGLTVAHGLGKGGDGTGGGGGAAGMGGALFINRGQVVLRRTLFQDNLAVGGDSDFGGDGNNGGGGGFGGANPDTLGEGADGGLLQGQGGAGYLDGTQGGGGSAFPPPGAPPWAAGAGGGAARGGDPAIQAYSAAVWSDNEPGGRATWGGGGGFSVGPEGGGGDSPFGGGGGGSGGRFLDALGTGTFLLLPGAADGGGGFFGGDGNKGDGAARTGQGGGGGGLGGAIFLRGIGDQGTTLDMYLCRFVGNQALPGEGAERGLGKGGAVFVYAYPYRDDQPFPLAELQAQEFAGNLATDLVEDPGYDNANFYVAQTAIIQGLTPPGLIHLYRQYRRQIRAGLPWYPP